MAQSYDDYISGQNFRPPEIAPEFSLAQRAFASAALGAQESVIFTGAHAVNHWLDGKFAERKGESFVTKEQVEQISPNLEFREGEYLSQTMARHDYFKRRRLAEEVSSEMNMAGQFAWGMVGGMADLPLMLAPAGAAMGVARAGAKAATTGVKYNTAKALVKAADMAKVPTFRGAVLGATAEQAAEANFVLSASNYTGREYGAFDAIADVAFGGILTTGLNAPLISKANRIARQQGRMTADIRATEAFFTSGEYTEGTNLLRKYSEDLDLVIKADPEVEAALNTPKDQRTPEAEAKVREFIDEHISDIKIARDKSDVSVDPDKPIAEAREEAADLVSQRYAAKSSKQRYEDEKLAFEKSLQRELQPKAFESMEPWSNLQGFEAQKPKIEALREELTELRDPELFAAEIVSGTLLESDLYKKNTARQKEIQEELQDIYFELYSAEIESAQKLVTDLFGVKAKKGKIQVGRGNDLGFVYHMDSTIHMGHIADWAQHADRTPSQLVFHEAMHVLSNTAPDVWKKLLDIIEVEPKLNAKLSQHIKDIGYDANEIRAEAPSHLIEWAVMQPDFWSALKASDATLYSKFLSYIGEMYKKARALYKNLASEYDLFSVTTEDLENATPQEIAHAVGSLLGDLKAGRVGQAQKDFALSLDRQQTYGAELRGLEMVKNLRRLLGRTFWMAKKDKTRILKALDGMEKGVHQLTEHGVRGADSYKKSVESFIEELKTLESRRFFAPVGFLEKALVILKEAKDTTHPVLKQGARPKNVSDVTKAAAKLGKGMDQANKSAAKRTVQREKARAKKVEEGAKKKPQESAKKAVDAIFGPRIQSLINTKIDPDKPAGIVYREIIDKIQRQVKNKKAADNLIDLAIALRDISIYQQKAEELLSNGYVTDPNYKVEDLIREGVFLDLEDTSVTLGEAELDTLVAGLEPEEAARVKKESEDHLKVIQEKVDAFQSTQQRTPTLFKQLMFARHKIEKGEMTHAEAKAHLKENIDVYSKSLMARQVADHHTLTRHDHLKGKRSNHILKYFKTLMDGRPRKGVAIKDSSVESKILAQIQDDQGAISQALISNGLYDLFMGVSTVSAASKMNPDAQSIYGTKLKEASDLFWADLMNAARHQELPESWKGVKALEDVYTAFIATNENLRNQLNELGAGIRYREGFTGLSQRWDERSVIRYGEDEWRADMEKSVDWEATEAAHGGVMNIVTDENGTVTDWQEFDREAFLTEWYKEIKSHKPEDHPSVDIVQSFGKHRAIVMKESAEIPMTQKYSGHKSLGLLYMNQIRHRSEMIAVAKSFGTRPLSNFEALARRHDLDPEASVRDIRTLSGATETLNMKHLLATVRYITGALDNPANKTLDRYSKNFRKISNIAFLPMSGISAISDIPMIALTLQQQGMLPMDEMGDFVRAYAQAHARQFGGGNQATKQILHNMGAGLDSALNAAAARVALADPSDPDILGKLNDGMFTINYLNGITTAGQEAFMDVLTKSLAEQIKAEDLNPLTVQMLDGFGFTVADMKVLVNSVETGVDGVDRVGPTSIKDEAVARKTREMYLQLMNEAVMFPDAGTQSLVRGGLQAGTLAGEAMRDAFQYSSFPLAMTRIITRKFMTNYQGTSPWTNHQTGRIQMVAFVGSMLAMGYMATIIKDLIRGREPMHLANMSGKGWERVVAQSGIAGVLEPMLAAGTGDVRGSVAPLPNTIGAIVGEALSGDAAGAIDDARPLYGSAYPLVGPAVAKIIGWAFGESVKELQDRRSRILESMYKLDNGE